MALGKRKPLEQPLFITFGDLNVRPNPYYESVNKVLAPHQFDSFVEQVGKHITGQPSLFHSPSPFHSPAVCDRHLAEPLPLDTPMLPKRGMAGIMT
jgi:hypothetical protein